MAECCPACAGTRHAVFVEQPVDREYFKQRSQPASFMRCEDCRSLFQDPWPSHEEVQGFYESDYQNYTTTSVPLLAQLNDAFLRRQGAAFIDRHGVDAAVLDFGCGQGGFLRVLAEIGCKELAGFDFVLYEELENTPNTRLYDDVDAIVAGGQRFDVIRMHHVIEHLTDLDGTMTTLVGLLKPHGCIIGQTPNAAHYTSDLMGQYWGPLHYPYHTVLFSPQGLASAAGRWRLPLVATSGPLLPTGWALSLENKLKDVFNSKSRGRTAAYTFIMGFSMPMAIVDRLRSPKATANFDFTLVGA